MFFKKISIENKNKLIDIYENLIILNYNSQKYSTAYDLINQFIFIIKKQKKTYNKTWKQLNICQQKLEIYTKNEDEKKSIGFEKAMQIMKNFIENLK